ncbi:MAG TPA: YCF48-related protein, partial [bacterium]
MILIIFLCYWQIGIGFSQETILLTFQAVAGDELTLLFWETRNETNLAGFVLLRSENDSSGNFNEIASYLQDSTLIAQGTEGCYSRRYSWLDLGLSNGTQYWYKLILIGKSSEQKSYGTAPVVPAEGKTIYQSTDDLGWEWQNPLPSGNYPCDVDFVDADHGWIVGERNTILRTTDGGRSWKFLNPGVGLPKTAGKFAHIDFEDVHFFDSLHGLVSGCIYCVFDDNDVINESIILKTNDGGETWKPTFQSQYPGARSPSLFFINSFEGWASVFPDKGIFRTEDGGNSWQFAGTYPPKFAADTTENGSIWYIDPYFSQLFFTTPDSGWGYPVERSLFLTSDGGCTWTRKEFLIGPEYDLFFTNRNMGYLIEAYDGKLYRTLDGGETWALYHTFNEGYFPYLIRFKSDAEGVIIGKNTLFKTNDGGENWISLPINFNHHPLELDFAADNGLWMVNWNIYVDNCSDWVRHSTDGGLSWQSLYQGIYGDFIEVDFLNLEKGWVLGNDYNYQSEQNKGLILRT